MQFAFGERSTLGCAPRDYRRDQQPINSAAHVASSASHLVIRHVADGLLPAGDFSRQACAAAKRDTANT